MAGWCYNCLLVQFSKGAVMKNRFYPSDPFTEPMVDCQCDAPYVGRKPASRNLLVLLGVILDPSTAFLPNTFPQRGQAQQSLENSMPQPPQIRFASSRSFLPPNGYPFSAIVRSPFDVPALPIGLEAARTSLGCGGGRRQAMPTAPRRQEPRRRSESPGRSMT